MSGLRKRKTIQIRKNVKIIKKDENTAEIKSPFFETPSNGHENDSEKIDSILIENVSDKLLENFKVLNKNIANVKFSAPVKYVYNPTEYAYDTFSKFTVKFGSRHKDVLFLGMNPGPWGMSQTGVPFGEINAVRDWLKISGEIGKPPVEAPDRPVLGFQCTRSEVSGKRFWELARHLCITPEKFFENCFVYNYCPLQFIGNGGKNVTPDEMKVDERDSLNKFCDDTLLKTMEILNTKIAVGIGLFAEKRLKTILKTNNINNIEVCSIPHPSPRAAGNTNWQEKTLSKLNTLNLLRYFTK